jgi:hypothetical protein
VRYRIDTGVLNSVTLLSGEMKIKGFRSGDIGGTRLLSVKGLSKLLLSAFLMKRINSRIARSSGGIVSKYAKLMLVGYLFKKLKAKNIALPKFEKEAEPVKKAESKEKARGSSIMGFGKVIVGVLAGATIIYAVKKFAAKNNWHKIQVQ